MGFPANIAHVYNYACLRTGRVSTTPRLIVMHLLVADTGATVVPLFYSTLITGSLRCTRPKEERRFISHLATRVCVHAHVAIKTTRSRGISGQCRKSLVAPVYMYTEFIYGSLTTLNEGLTLQQGCNQSYSGRVMQ